MYFKQELSGRDSTSIEESERKDLGTKEKGGIIYQHV